MTFTPNKTHIQIWNLFAVDALNTAEIGKRLHMPEAAVCGYLEPMKELHRNESVRLQVRALPAEGRG